MFENRAHEFFKIAGNSQNIRQLIKPTRIIVFNQYCKMLDIKKIRMTNVCPWVLGHTQW